MLLDLPVALYTLRQGILPEQLPACPGAWGKQVLLQGLSIGEPTARSVATNLAVLNSRFLSDLL